MPMCSLAGPYLWSDGGLSQGQCGRSDLLSNQGGTGAYPSPPKGREPERGSVYILPSLWEWSGVGSSPSPWEGSGVGFFLIIDNVGLDYILPCVYFAVPHCAPIVTLPAQAGVFLKRCFPSLRRLWLCPAFCDLLNFHISVNHNCQLSIFNYQFGTIPPALRPEYCRCRPSACCRRQRRSPSWQRRPPPSRPCAPPSSPRC